VQDPRNGRGFAVVRIEDPQGGREGYTFDIEWSGGYNNGNGYGNSSGRYDDGSYRNRGVDNGGYNNGRYNDGRYNDGGYNNRSNTSGVGQAVGICEDEVRRRIGSDGWDQVNTYNGRIDDGPGRNDWVNGTAVARRNGRQQEFRYSCQVNLSNGRVRNVQIDRR
jgi:hypothetical protein